MSELSKCRSCGESILFFPTAASSGLITMPVNATPDPKGKLVLTKGQLVVLTGDLFDKPPDGVRYTSHYATCSDGTMFRKKKKR